MKTGGTEKKEARKGRGGEEHQGYERVIYKGKSVEGGREVRRSSQSKEKR